ncbi:MAG: glycosyl hydrolase 53 family protein [Planctomycetes bacterium]|nr:glycosyl hydrolase 53 family protein [Planctomycetota bacterium]
MPVPFPKSFIPLRSAQFAAAACACLVGISGHAAETIRAVDCSFIPQIESLGGVFRSQSQPVDPIAFFASQGINTVRLRVWHSPADGFCDTAQTLALAQRAHAGGMKLLIDFHYSDSWADPGQQNKPASWSSLSFPQLKTAIRLYTLQTLSALAAQGTPADIVQLGNEITGGMLWIDGKVSFWGDPNWQNLAELLNAGAEGVRLSPGGDEIRIMLHIDRGGDNPGTRAFFDRAEQYAVDYDMIGLSYYPWWHGTLDDLRTNVADAADRYGKPVLIAETAYPWSLAWADAQNNFVWQTSQLLPGFDATPHDQREFLESLFDIQRRVTKDLGAGVCYWAPEYAPFTGLPSPWENLALFDFSGNALEAWHAFTPFCAGDLNADRIVDDADFVAFAHAYNLLDCADPAMPQRCPADLNFDNAADDADFVLFAGAYDQLVCP